MINDGSPDDTWEPMNIAAARYLGWVTCLDLGSNQGKRAAMAASIRATEGEFVICVDSDSMPAPWAMRKLVQAFAEPKVGAISGLTYVRLCDHQLAHAHASGELLRQLPTVEGGRVGCEHSVMRKWLFRCLSALRRDADSRRVGGPEVVWAPQVWNLSDAQALYRLNRRAVRAKPPGQPTSEGGRE